MRLMTSTIEVWIPPAQVPQMFCGGEFCAYNKPSGWFEQPLYRRVRAVISTADFAIISIDLVEGRLNFQPRVHAPQ